MSKKQKQHQMIVPGQPMGVKVVNNDFTLALKTWKRKLKFSGVIDAIKNNKEFVKPSVQKRHLKQRAKYIQHIKDLQY
jgi:ribosomal protein S21